MNFGLALLAGALLLSGCSPPAPEPPLDVCTVLENPQKYQGKRMTISGAYWFALTADCPKPFRTGERTYASSISMTVQTAGNSRLQAQWNELELAVLRQAQTQTRGEIRMRASGVFHAVTVDGDGRIHGGYGHLGALGAELIVDEVTNVQVLANPRYDYAGALHPRAQ